MVTIEYHTGKVRSLEGIREKRRWSWVVEAFHESEIRDVVQLIHPTCLRMVKTKRSVQMSLLYHVEINKKRVTSNDAVETHSLFFFTSSFFYWKNCWYFYFSFYQRPNWLMPLPSVRSRYFRTICLDRKKEASCRVYSWTFLTTCRYI